MTRIWRGVAHKCAWQVAPPRSRLRSLLLHAALDTAVQYGIGYTSHRGYALSKGSWRSRGIVLVVMRGIFGVALAVEMRGIVEEAVVGMEAVETTS